MISQDYHGIDVLHDHNYFDSSQCEVMHDETALFLSPWNQWNFFHCHDENLISSFANILTTRGPKRILYQLDHFNQSSEPVAVAAATAQRLCNKLFDILWEGNTTSFKAVRTGVHCFKHIRWGRGPRQFIGERVIPFRDAKKTPFPAATNAFSPDVEALRFHDGLGPPDWDGLTTLFQKRMLSRLNIPFRTRPCRKKDGSWKEGCSNEGHTDTWLSTCSFCIVVFAPCHLTVFFAFRSDWPEGFACSVHRSWQTASLHTKPCSAVRHISCDRRHLSANLLSLGRSSGKPDRTVS